MGSRFVIIDGHAIANRAFYAMPLLTNAEGEYTNAVYGFAMMLLKVIQDSSPTHMAVAFDKSAPTFRHEHYAEYKAHRKGMPDELRPQIGLIRELVSAFGLPVYEKEGFEADDLIGTVVKSLERMYPEMDISIVTGDRDVLQLVSDRVTALITKKGVTELDVYDETAVRNKFGLAPRQLIDVKALMGDASDNIPGVPGIGEKTALKIVQTFGSLAGALDHLDEVTPPRAREAMRQNMQQALDSRMLAEIRLDAPVDIDIERLSISSFDGQRIQQFFRRMGFRSLLSKVDKLAEIAPVTMRGDASRQRDTSEQRDTSTGRDRRNGRSESPQAIDQGEQAVVTGRPPDPSGSAADQSQGTEETPCSASGQAPGEPSGRAGGQARVYAPRQAPGQALENAPGQELAQASLCSGDASAKSAGESRQPSLLSGLEERRIAVGATRECRLVAPEEVEELVARLRGDRRPVVFDLLLTAESAIDAKAVGVALYSDAVGHPCYLPASGFASDGRPDDPSDGSFLALLRPLVEDPSVPKYMHDAKPQIGYLMLHGLRPKGIAFDTKIAAYLLNPSSSSYSLADLLFFYTDDRFIPESPLYGKGSQSPDATSLAEVAPDRIASSYARVAGELLGLAAILEEKLAAVGMTKLFREVEMPLVSVLARMEITGFRIDVSRLRQLSEDLGERAEDLAQSIYHMAGERFNINSTKQLGAVLFERLGLPVVKRTKTGYSTDQEVLEKLAETHEIAQAILDYRSIVKLKGTYIDAFPALINRSTGRIHTSFNQTVTTTGRLSSTNPNLQNIPVRTEEGRRIRQVFIPGDGFDYILAADYSQIELRVLAHISGDPALIQAFNDDVDIHTSTAAKVFGVRPEEVTPEQRSRAKAVNFGIVYGISDFGLARNLRIPTREARKYIDSYFALYHEVKRYMDRCVELARENGYVTTMLGRRRYLPELASRNLAERKFAERTAMNTPIQGTAADLIKIAMVRVQESMEEKGLRSRMLLQVHDELVFEVVSDEVEALTALVKDGMESAIELSVPLRVSISVGSNWLEAK